MVFKDCVINIGETFKKLEDITTKELYYHLVSSKFQRPTRERKWIEKLHFLIDEDMLNLIYVNDRGLTPF